MAIIKIFKNVDIRASELNFFIFVPDEDPEIDVKSKKKVSFLELVSSIKCLFPGKEKFNGKIKSLQFYHENHTKPQEKGANRHIGRNARNRHLSGIHQFKSQA